mmetsp:Transcript_20434/g.20554  ORF Transcript_20434/g.20554 Transcript_20434/m.20554 type:complete len:294 (-) Transcript_20434:181-1062(-)
MNSRTIDECKHTTRTNNTREREQNAMMFLSYVANPDLLLQKAANLVIPSEFKRNWNNLAQVILSEPNLTIDKRARLLFLELAVDAFLNHDYPYSRLCYSGYLFLFYAIQSDSMEKFLQSPLMPTYENQAPNSSSLITPWRTKVIIRSSTDTIDDIIKPVLPLKQRLYQICQGEHELLSDMISNNEILCSCLTVEDPYHSNFNSAHSTPIFDVPLRNSVTPYILDCAGCRRPPDITVKNDFKRCSRCKRVRYCSVDCQRDHWPIHKKDCGKKMADWWGKAPVMSKQQRYELGLL